MSTEQTDVVEQMSEFPLAYRQGRLYVEDLSLQELVKWADTPFYLYSKRLLLNNIREWKAAVADLPAGITFALKANDNLRLLELVAKEGLGADIVSGGELFLARRAGIPAERIVFAGVGKQEKEIREALQAGIRAFNVESWPELELIQKLAAELGKKAPIHVRVNPDIDPKSHPYISTGLAENKFGLPAAQAKELILRAARMPNIAFRGLHVHIGSQITDLSPFTECGRALRAFYDELIRAGVQVTSIDLGGGLGVDYHQVIAWPPNRHAEVKPVPPAAEYVRTITGPLRNLPVQFVFEPGRSLVANAGLLVTRVLYRKETPRKRFLVVDAAMNDLIRPSLYGAYHRILPVVDPVREKEERVDIVGPVCETGDFLARDRRLPVVTQGEYLAVFSAGAYAYVLSSNYNARPRPAEYLVDGKEAKLIRRREQYEDWLKLYEV